MTSLLHAPWQSTRAGASRRSMLQGFAAGALAAVPLARALDETEARKNRKKSRRKKKRKNQQPNLQVRTDITCPGPQDDAFIVGGQALLAQSFTAGQSGALVRVDLTLDHGAASAGDFFLRLAPLVDAFPGAGVLASTQVSASAVPNGVSAVPFTFVSPAQVQAGASYALVLSRDGQDSYTWTSRLGEACGGRGFIANNSGEPFKSLNQTDFIFTTFVEA